MAVTTVCLDEADGRKTGIVELKLAEIAAPSDVSRLKSDLVSFVNKNKPDLVVVDWKGVKYVSTDVFGVMLSIHRWMDEWKGQLRLCNIHPFIVESIEQCGLERILPVFEDMQSARKPEETG